MKRVEAVLALVLIVAAACSGDNAGGTSDGSYVVGLTADITGPTGPFFAGPREGLELYFKELNDSGGIDGHEVELLVEDNRAVAETAAAQARQFLGSEDVHLVALSAASVTINAVLGETARAGVPMLTVELPCTPEIAVDQIQPTLFCFSDTGFDGELMANILADEDSGASVVGVSYDVPSSRSAIETALSAGEELGLDAGENVVVPLDFSDPGPFAARILRTDPDWVVGYGTWEHTAGPIFEELRRRGWDGRYLFSGISSVEGHLDELQDPGFYSANWATMTVDSNPQMEALTEASEKYGTGDVETSATIYGWLGGLIIETALRECGWPCDPQDMAEIMENLSVDTEEFTGAPVEFSSERHAPTLPMKVYRWDVETDSIEALSDWVGGEG